MVDICIICEGTYPYITGGVSAWVHNIIKDFPNFTFGIVHIASKKDEFREMKYKLPPNVVEFVDIYIHETIVDSDGKKEIGPKSFDFYSFHQDIKKGVHGRFPTILNHVSPGGDGKVTAEQILYSPESFDMTTMLYNEFGDNTSFIDYYWTFRTTHMPLIQMLNAPIMNASIYHAVSTGYAGLYGVMAKLKTNSPLVLTEHGIYTVERKIEVAEAAWILDEATENLKIHVQIGKIKDFWIKIFDFLSKLTYKYADELVSLYSENKKMQVSLGADAKRILLIPNGIDLSRFENLKGRFGGEDGVLKVGFVGRVVPIKDVETFVRACKIISESFKNIEFYVVGPEDEDLEYSRNIRNLVSNLGLGGKLKFTGLANSADYYKIIDVLVITSISEVQPLVILEAMAAGVPTVATNVGACKEMLFGDSPADKKFGSCGLITKIKSPEDTAASVIRILKDHSLWREMSIAGQKRVQKYYQKKHLVSAYRKIYFKQLASKIRWANSE
ncbi:MAG TPA: GT4 family glycosyltransferase PelF [Candidatus Wallbacteria bacterium]|nr:GT4 family glycosyltransferase PelF [Candidatus Wallbacteria bacterium]